MLVVLDGLVVCMCVSVGVVDLVSWQWSACVVVLVPREETVAQTRERLGQERRKYRSTMHLMAFTFANSFNVKVGACMKHTAMPIKKAHSAQVHAFATQVGVLTYHARAADARWVNTHMEGAWKVLERKDLILDVGFVILDSPTAVPDPDVVKEEHLLGETLVDLVRHMFFAEWVTMTTYTSRPPHRLAGLFHEGAQAQLRTLEWAKRAWEGLEVAELAARVDDYVAD